MSRRIDDLGRIVLPVELRRLYGIQPGDTLDISVEGDAILLRKLTAGCVFCGNDLDVRTFKDRTVCGSCIDELR